MGACPHYKIHPKRSSVVKEKVAVSYGIRQKFAPPRSAVGGFGGRRAPIFLMLFLVVFFLVLFIVRITDAGVAQG